MRILNISNHLLEIFGKSINTCNLDSSESHEIWNQRNCTLSDIVSKLLKRQTYSFFSKFLDIYRIFMDEIMIIWWQLYSTILTFYLYMHIRRYLLFFSNVDIILVFYVFFSISMWPFYLDCLCPTGIYLLQFSNGNTRTMCKICSKLSIKTPEQRQWSSLKTLFKIKDKETRVT